MDILSGIWCFKGSNVDESRLAVVDESWEHLTIFPVCVEVGNAVAGNDAIDPGESSSLKSEERSLEGDAANHFEAYLIVQDEEPYKGDHTVLFV